MRRSDALGTVVFDQGRPVLSLFSKGWDGVPVERPWDEWVAGLALRADVEERTPDLLATFDALAELTRALVTAP